MGFDPKQAVAAVLTLGLVFMIVNMVLHDPFSPFVQSDTDTAPQGNDLNALMLVGKSEETEFTMGKSPTHKGNQKLWGKPGPVLEPCWGKKQIKSKVEQRSEGYVKVRLSGGPHYHRSQVADAVVVARVLGATLLVPSIKEAAEESSSDFNDLYDIRSFIASLEGVVKVVRRLPKEEGSVIPTVVMVPNKVTAEYVEDRIRPVLNKKKVIELVGFFPSSSLKTGEESDKELDAIRCLVMYKALQFHAQVEKLGEEVLSRLRGESDKSTGGRIVAVDLRLDLLEQKGCMRSANAKSKKCFNGDEVGSFMQGLGFPSDTAIYLTQSKWDERLDSLKEKFPNAYTKEQWKLTNEDEGDLISGKTQLEKAIDFYVCSHSDVFVPAISGIFYSAVAGERIASGRTQILVPTTRDENDPKAPKLSSVISRYVKEKDHPVYSCLCNAPDSST